MGWPIVQKTVTRSSRAARTSKLAEHTLTLRGRFRARASQWLATSCGRRLPAHCQARHRVERAVGTVPVGGGTAARVAASSPPFEGPRRAADIHEAFRLLGCAVIRWNLRDLAGTRCNAAGRRMRPEQCAAPALPRLLPRRLPRLPSTLP